MDRFLINRAARGYSRRQFVQGLAGGVVAIVGAHSRWAVAAEAAAPGAAGAVLSGTEFALEMGVLAVNVTGRPGVATTVNGRLPAPLLRWREGDSGHAAGDQSICACRSSIHWHGVIVPADMDGVPGLSFDGHRAGRDLRLSIHGQSDRAPTGITRHSRFQEQTGLYGPIVIEPRGGRAASRRSRIRRVALGLDGPRSRAHLRELSSARATISTMVSAPIGDFFSDVRERRVEARDSPIGGMWASDAHGSDRSGGLSGYAYTYLMNGTTPAGNWTGLFRRGERIRLRFINGSSMSFFDVRIPGLEADGGRGGRSGRRAGHRR